MQDRSSKRPRDSNQLAKLVVDISTGNSDGSFTESHPGKNPAAVALGRLGGKKGGAARAAMLSPEDRKQIASKAAAARWGKNV